MSEKAFNTLTTVVGAISAVATALVTYFGESESAPIVGIIGIISTALVQIFSRIEGNTAAKEAEKLEELEAV